jgi:hypothetical protein
VLGNGVRGVLGMPASSAAREERISEARPNFSSRLGVLEKPGLELRIPPPADRRGGVANARFPGLALRDRRFLQPAFGLSVAV